MRAGDGYPGQQAFPPNDPAGQSGWPPTQASQPSAQSSPPPAGSGGPGTYPGGPGTYPGGPGGTQLSGPGGPGGTQLSGPGTYPGGPGGTQLSGAGTYPGGPGGPGGFPGGPAAQSGGPGGYPGGPGGFPGTPAGQPGTPVTQPGGPGGWAGGPGGQPPGPGGQPPGPGGFPGTPGGQPPGPGGGGRKTLPTWWIVPYLGGAAIVLAVFALVQLTVLRHPAGHAATAASSAGAAPQGPLPAQMFPDALYTRLTKDIQGHNQKDFLSLVAPGARPAVQTWWDNMQAIGFTTGLVMPTGKTSQVNLDSTGNGATTVLAGTHNALDPQDDKQKPLVPLERYQIGLHFSSAKAIGQITAWKPLGDDPWDQGKLAVRKAANVVVAGPASESSLVDETLPIAQAAAAYDVGLINHVNPNDLSQEGFVVFVSGDPATRTRWFSTTKQPSGWPPAFSSGFTAQLPGPGASADTAFRVGNLSAGTTGGARVVITPFEDQNRGTAQQETEELVTRFALDILSAKNQNAFAGLAAPPSVPAWAIEGFGIAFEATYLSNTNPTLDEYSFKALNESLKDVPASYKNGDMPTAAQLYSGPDQAQQNWKVVAGSVYASIATRFGMQRMLASAELVYTNDPDPRQNVLKSHTTKKGFVFYGQDTIDADWKAYLASPADSAPLAVPTGS